MVEKISPETVRERIERDSEFDLVDIRSDEDYTDEHIPGAEHLTVDELEHTVDDRDWADEVIVYCYIGQTSVQAARLITEYGNADVVMSMSGGYDAWESTSSSAD